MTRLPKRRGRTTTPAICPAANIELGPGDQAISRIVFSRFMGSGPSATTQMSSIQSSCHPERSEGPFHGIRTKVPRCARDDNFALNGRSLLPLLTLAGLVAQAPHAAQPAVDVAGLA